MQNATSIGGLIILLLWITGVVIAKGFWMTLATIIVAPYSIYIVIERVLLTYTNFV